MAYATIGLQISGNFILGNVGRGVLVWCRNASTGPALVGLPWPLFQNYNGLLLASHDGASVAAGNAGIFVLKTIHSLEHSFPGTFVPKLPMEAG